MSKYLTIKDVNFSVGDTIRVHQKIQDGDKSRTQIFEGVVISIQNRESGRSFRVRRVASNGVGVERLFPALAPSIERIEVKQAGAVRRAKLFYLRNRIGKAASAIRKKVKHTVAEATK